MKWEFYEWPNPTSTRTHLYLIMISGQRRRFRNRTVGRHVGALCHTECACIYRIRSQ